MFVTVSQTLCKALTVDGDISRLNFFRYSISPRPGRGPTSSFVIVSMRLETLWGHSLPVGGNGTLPVCEVDGGDDLLRVHLDVSLMLWRGDNRGVKARKMIKGSGKGVEEGEGAVLVPHFANSS